MTTLHSFNQALTVAGEVAAIDPAAHSFTVKARSGDEFEVVTGAETIYQVLRNLDGLGRDRVPDLPRQESESDTAYQVRKYLSPGRRVFVDGVYQEHDDRRRYQARLVHLLHSDPGLYVFEETHWWPSQATQLADRILDHLFDARRSYSIDDFSELYRTTLNIVGQPTDDTTQECAVLSRLIYDLSSAYLLTGAERYLLAAQAAVNYLREAFRSLSHDGRHCFWAYGRQRNLQGERGERLLFASQGPDDVGAIPLYEQIYALAGLAQFYRVTLQWEVLEDIRRTLNTFQDFFWDPPSAKEKGFEGAGGYYSHLDPSTMRPDTVTPEVNRSRKNWNSVGDHIPAYLVNLILALEPLPQGPLRHQADSLLRTCTEILEETSWLICEKFPDPDSDYVYERFHANWTPDLSYRWQQDRAVVGHDLKIAWNLTRCAFYFQGRARRLGGQGRQQEAADCQRRSQRCLEVARRLGDRMAEVGLDKIRGGIFDCVERHPSDGRPTQFAWGSTKDFWQQEQGILAYLILYSATSDPRYLQLARESSAFWNLFFLDRQRQGYFFRTTENGLPILEGQYGMKSSHAIGYHVFELAYLAHLYTRAYVTAGNGLDNTFCLYFKIDDSGPQESINVLPDFMPPGRVRISSVRANGQDVTDSLDPANLAEYQLPTQDMVPDPKKGTVEIVVEFEASPAQP